MPKTNSIIKSYEEKRRHVSQLNLTSDIFFCKVMENIPACEEFIQILTGRCLKIHEIRTQYSLRNLESHSIVLDILAEAKEIPDKNITKNTALSAYFVNIEMQMSEDEDHIRRVRFNQSCIDVSMLEMAFHIISFLSYIFSL